LFLLFFKCSNQKNGLHQNYDWNLIKIVLLNSFGYIVDDL
jgi:hypothetical protein